MRKSGFIRRAANAVVVVVCLVAAGTTYAQTQTLNDSQPPVAKSRERSRFVISARAGAVNLVAGRAILKKRGGELLLTPSVDLEAGDVIETGQNGTVEILLAPGSYFRIGTSSTVEMVDTSLEHVRLRVGGGSAITEITADAKDAPTEILTPHGNISLTKKGLYRVNVARSATELLVRKGEVRVAGAQGEIKVKKNEVLTLSLSGGLTAQNKSSFDKNSQDTFDAWSRDRAQTLVAFNQSLGDSKVETALDSYLSSISYRPSRYSPHGLWVYDSFFGYRTFLPFSSGWGSPYGFGYRSSLGWPSGYYYPGRPVYSRPTQPWPNRETRPTVPPRHREHPGVYKNPTTKSYPPPMRPSGGGVGGRKRGQ